MEKKRLCLDFRHQVDAWVAQNPIRNVTMLASNSKVSTSSVRRFYNSEAVPNAENILKILVTLTNRKTISGILETLGADSLLAEYIRSTFDYLANDVSKKTETVFELEDFLKDSTSYVIFKRISHCDSVTKTTINSLLGQLGESRLDEMITSGIIGQKEDGTLEIAQSANSEFTLPSNLWKKHFCFLIENFLKPKITLQQGNSAVKNLSNSVDQEGFRQAKDILKDTAIKLQKVFENHPGNIPLFFTAVMDTLSFDGDQ